MLFRSTEDCVKLQNAIEALKHIDIDAEVQAHRDLDGFYTLKKTIDDLNLWLRQIAADDLKLEKQRNKLSAEIEHMNHHRCYACGTEIHDNSLDATKAQKQRELQEIALQLLANDTQKAEHRVTLLELGELGTAPAVFYDTLEDALNHKNSLTTLKSNLATRELEADPYGEQIEDMQGQALQTVSYDTINELTRLQEHKSSCLNC